MKHAVVFAARDMAKTPISDANGAKAAPQIVALAGFMGSGKTSTGQALSDLLGWEFIDLDSEIEAHEGAAIRHLVQERGEAAFREIENEALLRCLERCFQSTVMALGGGAFAQPNNAEVLRRSHALSVFLDTPIEDMLQRCGVQEEADPANPRPLAADASAFRNLYEKRMPYYREASVTVNTAGKSVAEVAREIAEKLGLKPER